MCLDGTGVAVRQGAVALPVRFSLANPQAACHDDFKPCSSMECRGNAMSLNDFIDGQISDRILNGSRGNTINLWKAHAAKLEQERKSWKGLAQQLQQKLAATEIEVVREDAHGTASFEMLRELRQRLATVAPADPMGAVITWSRMARQSPWEASRTSSRVSAHQSIRM